MSSLLRSIFSVYLQVSMIDERAKNAIPNKKESSPFPFIMIYFLQPHVTTNIPTSSMGHSIVLIREDLLTTLASGHTVLLLFPELGRSQLLGLFGRDDLVAHGVEFSA